MVHVQTCTTWQAAETSFSFLVFHHRKDSEQLPQGSSDNILRKAVRRDCTRNMSEGGVSFSRSIMLAIFTREQA
jgi:hypothetical protein